MIFRKNSLLFFESQVIYIFLSTSSLFIIPVLGIDVWSLYFIPLLIITTINPILFREYIRIDEHGIRCYKAKITLWEYEWSSISYIRRGSRYRFPTAEIYLEEVNNSVPSIPVNYFQLGKSAKKALAFYGVKI